HVLVVDDHATNRRILEETLVNWSMKPTAVASGPVALVEMKRAAAEGTPFPLVLLDAMMPEMDGFMLAEEIKQHPELAGATVMMLSSAGRPGDAARCWELGVATYLTKPVKQSELLDAILSTFGKVSPEGPQADGTVQPAPARPRRTLKILLAEDN